MENCLVTKLKATVNNDNLAYLTKIKIEVSDNENASVNLYADNASLWTCQGNCYFTDSEDKLNYGQSRENSNSVRLRGSGVVFVENKYALGQIAFGRTPKVSADVTKILPYVVGGVQDYLNSAAYGDVTGIKTNATDLLLGSGMTGDISYLVKNSPNLVRIVDSSPSNLNPVLDLKALDGKSINIQSWANVFGDFDYLAFSTQYGFGTQSYTAITGSIEGYVAKSIAQGGDKVSGTFTFSVDPKRFANIKYQGVRLADNGNVLSSYRHFSWDAQGNITWS